MPIKRRNRLEFNEIDIISLVDAGDNPDAHVMIHKKRGSAKDAKEGNIEAMNVNDDDRIGFWKRLGVMLGVANEDGLILKKEDELVDKEAQEKIDKLQAELDVLKAKSATAEAITAANESIAKAKSIPEIDAVLAKLEDVDVIKAVTDRAADRRIELDKSAGDEVVKEFRAGLPAPLQEAFDKLEVVDQASFMKSYGGSKEDPVIKTVETLVGENTDLKARLEKMETRDAEAEIEKALTGLDGIVPSVLEIARRIAKQRKTDPDGADASYTEYKALAAQAQEKGLLKILGQDKGASGTAETEIDKAVEKYRVAHPDVTKEAAEAVVLEENQVLYQKYLDEQKEGA